MNQDFHFPSSFDTSGVSGAGPLESNADIARILAGLLPLRQFSPSTASNARELQHFALGIQTAVQALSLPTVQGVDPLDYGPERIIDPASAEGSLLAGEGIMIIEESVLIVGFFDDANWSLPLLLRQKLYTCIYLRLGDYDYLKLWYKEGVRANVLLLHHLEEFILHAAQARNGTSPPPDSFVVDVATFIQILITPHPSASTTLNFQLTPAAQPRRRFWDSRFDSWNERWGGHLNDEHILSEYVEGLSDAVFGVWEKPSRATSFHDAGPNHRCADQIFTTLSSGQPDIVKVIRDHRVFDAAYIETYGPFRFKTTDRLDRHLTIQGHDILFFTDWRKWVGLCFHAALQTDQANTGFEVLANARLGRIRTSRRSARATGSIPISLLVMQYFCFYVEALGFDFDEPRGRRRTFFMFSSNGAERHKMKRHAIAARLGIDLQPLKQLKDVANRRQSDEWGLALHLEPFDERANRLVETLSNWKPETFWEMSYPGYGGVDPIGLYGFHFAIFLGFITILGFALAIAQTIAQFQANSLH
jgi:hypothetical protein